MFSTWGITVYYLWKRSICIGINQKCKISWKIRTYRLRIRLNSKTMGILWNISLLDIYVKAFTFICSLSGCSHVVRWVRCGLWFVGDVPYMLQMPWKSWKWVTCSLINKRENTKECYCLSEFWTIQVVAEGIMTFRRRLLKKKITFFNFFHECSVVPRVQFLYLFG